MAGNKIMNVVWIGLMGLSVAASAHDGGGECSRRIRGEGEESTLVILKPDAVRDRGD